MLNLLFGNILAITPADIYQLIGLVAVVAVVHILFYKEFLLSSFDPETAETLGVKVKLWDGLFYLVLGVVIAVCIRIVGVLLVFAFLVMPGVIALALAKGVKPAMKLAVGVSIMPVVGGLYLSFRLDLPSAAVIIMLLFVLLLVTLPVARLLKA